MVSLIRNNGTIWNGIIISKKVMKNKFLAGLALYSTDSFV